MGASGGSDPSSLSSPPLLFLFDHHTHALPTTTYVLMPPVIPGRIPREDTRVKAQERLL